MSKPLYHPRGRHWRWHVYPDLSAGVLGEDVGYRRHIILHINLGPAVQIHLQLFVYVPLGKTASLLSHVLECAGSVQGLGVVAAIVVVHFGLNSRISLLFMMFSRLGAKCSPCQTCRGGTRLRSPGGSYPRTSDWSLRTMRFLLQAARFSGLFSKYPTKFLRRLWRRSLSWCILLLWKFFLNKNIKIILFMKLCNSNNQSNTQSCIWPWNISSFKSK